ncbi:MAG: CehA/McbA family metallohydrolase [Candidatus Bipolaricaulota bacterium]
MTRFMALALGAFAAVIAAGSGLTQSTVEVLVHVTMDGESTDAMVVTTSAYGRTQVAYNEVRQPGLVRLSLSPGNYALRVERGAGFTSAAVERQITVYRGRPLELSVDLTRAFSPAASWGYYSADLHIHSSASWDGFTPPDQLVAVQLAADLDVGCITDHNTIAGHVSFTSAAEARGFPVILSEEITSLDGHWNAFPLDSVVDYNLRKTPTDYFTEARAAGAQQIQACHPMHPLFGYFHLQGRPKYDDTFDLVEIYSREFSREDTRTIERLYELWNEGYRYVAVGVSDDHNWRTLTRQAGRARTYVHLEGELTVEGWLDALAAGRAYATYGPHVKFTAQEGTALPGDTVTLTDGEAFELAAEVVLVPRHGQRALSRARVIRNGEVVEEVALTGDRATVSWTDRPTADAWYALTVQADDGDRAHSNPIWVTVTQD